MAKAKTVYVCSECGGISPKWRGQCPHCTSWNSLSETVQAPPAANGGNHRFQALAASSGEVQVLAEVQAEEAPRDPSGSDELDRVLGGGLVRGAVILIGGDPGIGKSTLLLQTLASVGARRKVLYVTGEESAQQVALLPRGWRWTPGGCACWRKSAWSRCWRSCRASARTWW